MSAAASRIGLRPITPREQKPGSIEPDTPFVFRTSWLEMLERGKSALLRPLLLTISRTVRYAREPFQFWSAC